jgi:ribosomal protein S18 acetylase RimI-like enzyme
MRRGTPDDVDALIDICRDSFPESLLWTGTVFSARKWWMSAIASDSCETWICLIGVKIAGFCILITATLAWESERSDRDMNLFARLLAASVSPGFVMRRIWKKIIAVRTASVNESLSATSYKENGSDAWIGLIAVAPQMRRQGLARKMLQFCEERTLQLNRKAIKLVVLPDNRPACLLYKEKGFIRTACIPTGHVYTKILGRSYNSPESEKT